MQQNAAHDNTEGLALMSKAAPKGGCGERCPLSFSAPVLLLHVEISLHWWKTEARSHQPWYWKCCKTLMGVVVKVGDSAFQGSCNPVPGMARTVTSWGWVMTFCCCQELLLGVFWL